MKKILFFLILALSAAACSDSPADNVVIKGPFTLSVDRNTIESDGMQTATFIITDAEGTVLTDDESLMSKIYFKNENTGERLARRTKVFRSVEDGEYVFSATYSGEPCANTVTITSANRSTYEVFRKKVCLFRMTATWCQNCPSMTEGLDRISDWTKDRLVELDFHTAGSTYSLSDGDSNIGDRIKDSFMAPGVPSCVYDLDMMSTERSYSLIESLVFDRIAEFPATCGIKAESAYSSGTLNIAASVKTSTGGKYDLGYALLQDGCPGDASSYEQVYNNVVKGISSNYLYMSTSSADMAKDEQKQILDVEVPVTLSADAKTYSVVVYALKLEDGDVRVDNIVELPLNGSVDYVYNKAR